MLAKAKNGFANIDFCMRNKKLGHFPNIWREKNILCVQGAGRHYPF